MRQPEPSQGSTDFAQYLDPEARIPIAWTRLTIPQQGPAYLKRPRLIDALHDMIDRRLVLVRAPAGYGKTSLLVELAYETDLQVCWYTLEPQSSDLGVFLTHLIASIARRFPSFGKRSAQTLQDMEGQIYAQLRAFVATLVDEILATIPEYFFLILDDYHVLSESSNVHEFIRLLIDFMPEQCHLTIASRTVPPLPLIRLYARQQMAAIGVDELRFTEQETQELAIGGLNQALSDDQVHRLAQQTDGWVTAILLSANAGWDALPNGTGNLTIDLTETGIYDYLMGEVLAHLSEEVQRFLLHSAVLREMTVPLCTELYGPEARSVLRTLEKHNLFVTRVEQAGMDTVYRYHPLFHEFLSERLLDEDQDLYRELHTRAAERFIARQDWPTALTHSLRAERFLEAKELLLSHYDELDAAGHRESLAQWIDLLPPEYLSGELQFQRASLANKLGQVDTALRLYTNAFIHYESQGKHLDAAHALIERSWALSRTGGYGEAMADCQSALALLPDGLQTDSLRGCACHYTGVYHAETGDPVTALHYLSLAHQAWTRCSEPPRNLALLAQSTGMAYEMMGRFEDVLEQCQRALSIWESLDNQIGVADALNGIGVAQHRLGDYRTALATLSDALAKGQAAGAVRPEAYCLTSLADLYRDLGQFESALTLYAQAEQRNRLIGEPYLGSYITNARAEALYLAGQIERAQAEIESTLSEETLSKPHEAWQRIVLAATLIEQQNSQRARQELETVLFEPSLQSEVAFRGYIQLAQAAMIEDQPRESEQHLHTAIQLAQKAGLTQLLSVESLNHIRVLEFVVEQRGSDEELETWIEAARELETVRRELAGEEASELPEPTYPVLQIDALGGSRVLQDTRPVSWRTNQAKELFFYLLTHSEGRTKEQVGVAIWPEHSPAKLASIFRSSLFRVRKALFPEVVLFDGERYRLNPRVQSDYDVQTFEQSCASAEMADNPVQRAHHYRRAVDVYGGEFLVDLYADWIQHFREALQARYLQALTFLGLFNLDHRNHPQAISYARQILSVDEHHETAYHVLIRAYARSGQRPRAKSIYDHYRAMLAEFGLDPELDWEDLST